ncbi:MAG: hypothetical protein WC713_07830 [Candidatus Methylomirabilota bacterium]
MTSAHVDQSPAHRWRFFRAGGFDQVRLETGADLAHLATLDQKLWLALSCPVKGLEFEARTLKHIDGDQDGHLRAPEIIEAARWASALLKDPDLLARGVSPFPLSAIREDCEEGRRILASARQILRNLGRGDAAEISAADTESSEKIFADTPFNGDGVISPRSAETEEVKRLIGEIAGCLGSIPDRCGEAGIDEGRIAAFFEQAATYVEWITRPERESGLLPAGAATADAAAAFAAVQAKVDDYFTRCRLVEYDPHAARALNGSDEDYAALAKRDLSTPGEEVSLLPLAVAAPGRPLPLGQGLNPAWAGAVAAFRARTVSPILGERAALTESEWLDLSARFAGHQAWAAALPATPVSTLGLPRLQEILAGDGQTALLELLAHDKALESEANSLADVDRLVRYTEHLGNLANNFVSFRDFYTRRAKATFQAGTLYLDGRSFDLCIRVEDPNKHALLGTLSRLYLLYCDCVRGSEKITVAAAITNGDSDQLMVGRNGVFYDRQGRDWDATIVKIVDHPISIRQAFWSPYKRVAKAVSEQIQKFAAARAKASEQKAAANLIAAGTAAGAGKPAPPPPPPPVDAARFAGIFAAIGLAIGAIGTALASVVTGLLSLRGWQFPLVVIGVLLLISGPSVLLAWFKLRQRNLGPILDANGWAVNARAKINIPFGASLTSLARLPEGSERSLTDPYAEKRSPWPTALAVLIVLAAAAAAWWYLRGF